MELYHWLMIALGVVILFWIGPAAVLSHKLFKRQTKCNFGTGLSLRSYHKPIENQLSEAMARYDELPFVTVTATARDGSIQAAELLNCGYNRTAIIFHGFRSNPREGYFAYGQSLNDRGYNLLLVHMRAHGKSGGRHTALGLVEQYDAVLWADWVSNNLGSQGIALIGISLGAATVGYSANKLNNSSVKALVLDSAFDVPKCQILREFKEKHTPGFLLLPLMRLYGSLVAGINMATAVASSLRESQAPVCFVHGTADKTVPYSCSEQNYRVCTAEKHLMIVEGAEHTMAMHKATAEQKNAFCSFLENCFK